MNWVSEHPVRVGAIALLALFLTATAAGVGGPALAAELVINGTFETGDFGASWVHGAFRGANTNPNNADHVVVPDLPYAGSYSALLGFKYTPQRRDAAGYMYQEVTIPGNISSATLFFKVRQQGYDSTPYDPFVAQIRRTNNTVLQTVLAQTFPEYNDQFKDSGWISDDGAAPEGFDMMAYQGQTVRLYFEQANTIDDLFETWTFVDEVSLVYTKFVDLAVDGDGDDVFGATGSGAGGFGATSGLATDTLVYAIDVENEGQVPDTYQLSLAGPAGWNVWLEAGGVPQGLPYTTPVIPPGSVATYVVRAAPAPATAPGAYDFILDAVSTAQGSRFDSATLRAIITDANYGADMAVDGNGFGVIGENGSGGFALVEAPRDTTISYDLELINSGDGPADYRITTAPDAGASVTVWLGGTPFVGTFTTPVVPASGSLLMTLDVTVPQPNPGGDYQVIVTAAALPDTLKKDSIRAVLRVLAPKVDMIIGASGDDIYDGTFSGLGGSSTAAGALGTAVLFPLVIENESGVADSFQVSWVPPGAGWNGFMVDGGVDQNFPFTTAAIAPFSQAAYVLKIVIPGAAAFGTYQSFLNAVSLGDNNISESVTAAVSISDNNQIDMVVDGSGAGIYGPVGTGLGGSSTQVLAPGDSVTFSIDLQNLVGTNSMDVMWYTPPGWQVTFDGQSSPVAGYPAGVYLLSVVVPASEPGGTVDIIVDAQKTDKPFYMDSVIGRVVVVPPVVVDALIDGAGDGIFGATGTGLGGLSVQTRPAPATMNFTIELQNEGAGDDQYTVRWNSIPLWAATLDGSASPLATGTVLQGAAAVLTFQVTAPAGAAPGSYSYIIDVASSSDSTAVESVEARVSITGPPRADLVIDGDGAGVFGLVGTGQGGVSLRSANAGTLYNSTLEVRNAGSFADSFYVTWDVPAGWPAGNVLVSDGFVDHAAPFFTPVIGGGALLSYTVKVQVPAGAGTGQHYTLINAWSSLPPNDPESVALVTQTGALVRGIVFEDADHDGVFSPGDNGLGGVGVREDVGGLVGQTAGSGEYTFLIAGGSQVTIIEHNPSGFISISPDTVGPSVLNAGDTLQVDFADVLPLRLGAGTVLTGVAGGFVDFPHRIEVGTRGQITLAATAPAGVVTMFLLDDNGNGVFDGVDRTLQPADLDMDPALGRTVVSVLLRVFVPAATPLGTTIRVTVDAVQPIAGTGLTTSAQAADAVAVAGTQLGRITLQKSVDSGAAQPGEVVTYTISFFNPGVDSVQNVTILDPISPYVDPVPGAFGPGQDVEWVRGGFPTQYLTLDPSDGDECEYSVNERLLRLLFSKNGPFFLLPGQSGALSYKVVVQ
ncbi:MAG: hypothetical protein ACE5EO_00110 [Candidatus Krumholzibacteriia bacterium]